jgi:hypothetical protein
MRTTSLFLILVGLVLVMLSLASGGGLAAGPAAAPTAGGVPVVVSILPGPASGTPPPPGPTTPATTTPPQSTPAASTPAPTTRPGPTASGPTGRGRDTLATGRWNDAGHRNRRARLAVLDRLWP